MQQTRALTPTLSRFAVEGAAEYDPVFGDLFGDRELDGAEQALRSSPLYREAGEG
jgi:hypothetical protein